MPATITGTVFHDLNHNGVLDAGEPGIPGVYLTMSGPSETVCMQTRTNATDGGYSFSVSSAGTYRVYETVESAAACPPANFAQPTGFFLSNGPRVRTITVTAAQVNNGAVIGAQNFSHDTIDAPLSCTAAMVQFVNTPTEWFDIDIVTGASTPRGNLHPANNVNAIGYNALDDYIYGYDQTSNHIVRVDADQNLMQLAPSPVGLPSNGYNVGTFDLGGHLFLMVNGTARFYTVDLAPSSPTFLKLVDPTNGFAEQTGNYGTALSVSLNISDWAYSPVDRLLYGIRSVGDTAQVMQVDPATGAVTGLTTTMPPLSPTGRSWGAMAIDASGALYAIYNGDGGVFRFVISEGSAVGVRISTTFSASFNDAAMCPRALVEAVADIRVEKSAYPIPAIPGEILDYFVIVENLGPDTGENVILSDDTPPQLVSPEYSLDGGGTFFPWTGSIDLGMFAAGDARPVIIRGRVDPAAAGTIINTATVKSDVVDPNPDNNTSTIEVETAEAADIAVEKSGLPDPVVPGQTLTYTVKVSNLGPSDAQGVILADNVPDTLTDVVYSTDDGSTFLPWNGSAVLGMIPAGISMSVLIRGTVRSNAAGSIANTAIVSADTPDPSPDNNTDTAEIPIDASQERADLSITKTASARTVSRCHKIVYTLTVFNAGPDTARQTAITDHMPDMLGDQMYSLDGGTTWMAWNGQLQIGDLPAGRSVTVLLSAIVGMCARGCITNTANVSSATEDPVPTNNTDSATVVVVRRNGCCCY